jgi:glucose-1-phosphate cytidylyltransferase
VPTTAVPAVSGTTLRAADASFAESDRPRSSRRLSTMKTVILAGGLGTRLAEETTTRPKPMVEIGGRPILWHVLSIYAAHGCREFVVACGYKGEVIKRYFADYCQHHSDWTIDLRSGERTVVSQATPDWRVHLVDTGLQTLTGGRLRRLRDVLGDDAFMVTYGDGLGDIDIARLVEFHESHGRLATVTAVHPPARFGALDLQGDRVDRFSEKPQASAGWINGGFLVLQPEVLDLVDDDAVSLEKQVLERLAAEGQLMAYRHHGFFQPMDTLREKQLLEELWQSGQPPWLQRA